MLNTLVLIAIIPPTLMVIVPTIFSALPGKSWVLRVCDFPRAQVMWLGLGLVVVIGAFIWFVEEPFADVSGMILRVLSIALLVCVVVQLWWGLRLTPLVGVEIQSGSAEGDGAIGEIPRVPREGAVRVITSNVDYQNEDRAEALGALVGWRPHLLALVETDDPWKPLIEGMKEDYPWMVTEYRGEGKGMVLISRLPVESSEVRYLVENDRPSIWAEVRLPDGGLLRVVVLHPPPPGLPRKREDGRVSSKPRDIEIDLAARVVGERRDDTWVIAGDFNDVGWSATTLRAKRVSGLGDPRVGRGMYSTYPASWPFCRYPIDHLLVTKTMRLVTIERLDSIGSDHLPLLADFEIPSVDSSTA